ncbi:MAG: protein translocase subunit SecF [Candidatus Marinimicrobia bacterium]|nr:protein translocase subunit SecF [Candidatus Neomarinimicrobiota bacterium]
MRLLAHTNIDFLGKRKMATVISFSLIVMGLGSLVLKGGPLLGIDFTGGTLAQLQFAVPTNVAEIRLVLLENGFSRPTIQRFGSDNEMLIRMPAEETVQFSDRLKSALTDYKFTIRRLETVGPKIGEELKGKALWSVFYALLGILLYITIRFDRYYALGAVAALAHDVLITLGIFSLLNLEIDLAILAAFLTIVGYSLNDTIVVFDRIRENAKTQRRAEFYATVNRSVNQTLGRTVITSLTTLMVVTTLFLIGGEVIKYFAFAMIVGVIVGTYSSIYVASPLMAALESRAQERSGK